MAISVTKIWSREYKKVYTYYVSITGFTTYATAGVAFDLFGKLNLVEATSTANIESDASYKVHCVKAVNKLLFAVANTGAEVGNGVDISAATMYALVVGKRIG